MVLDTAVNGRTDRLAIFSERRLQDATVAEKLSALRTEDYFRERSSRANIKKARRILKRAGRRQAPVAGDER